MKYVILLFDISDKRIPDLCALWSLLYSGYSVCTMTNASLPNYMNASYLHSLNSLFLLLTGHLADWLLAWLGTAD